uniref:Secreted venom protein family 5 protein n=1 Tax=Pristhesancus plagipennis TaxID=1955184 RepID=A0A2K8JVG9_PRIPG|nr:secreted venom protein family 5 protein [Pristhesancus plagipennis]
MKPELLLVILLAGICFASAGQGIDEEDLELYNWENERTYLAANDEHIIKLNKGVDKVLGFIREAFAPLGEMGIPLPDISKAFGHAPYSGTFKASKGYFKNPATLQRTGDVEIIVKSDTTVTIQVQLGFQVAEAGFDQYNLDVLSLHHEGTVKVSVAQNSVTLRLTLSYYPTCIVHLDELKFDKLDGIKVDITGLGIFQSFFNELSTWLISNFESTFRDIVNKKLYETASLTIANKNVCKYFPQ